MVYTAGTRRINPKLCAFQVLQPTVDLEYAQCQRKRVTGEWCRTHHPDAIKARQIEAEARRVLAAAK